MAYRALLVVAALGWMGCGSSGGGDAGSADWSISCLPLDGDASELDAGPDGLVIDVFRDDTPDVADDYLAARVVLTFEGVDDVGVYPLAGSLRYENIRYHAADTAFTAAADSALVDADVFFPSPSYMGPETLDAVVTGELEVTWLDEARYAGSLVLDIDGPVPVVRCDDTRVAAGFDLPR